MSAKMFRWPKIRSGKPFCRPLPTRCLSNGEFTPIGQTPQQREVEREIARLTDLYSKKLGISRRTFLQTGCGMAAAFLAMNTVYGPVFAVAEAEASDRDRAEQRDAALTKQFIFDVQLHFVRNEYAWEPLLGLRRYAGRFNPKLKNEKLSLELFKFENFVQEVFLESQTTMGLLSGAPSDDPDRWFLRNDEIAGARATINAIAGSRRLLSHAIFTPGQPGWLDEIDRAVTELEPDSWKGYTIGDPLSPSRYPYRLDDEELMYPAYEKMVKANIRNVCIHKGLLPPDYKKSFAQTWQHAKVDDVGKAARDWPQLNFIIYHSALRPLQKYSEDYRIKFENTGYIPWVTELAAIPKKEGVDNVYAELGTAFATSAVTYPRHCAALLGTLIKGMGVDHVLWGTDSVWYGSPQWQIEALRRIEIPEDLRAKYEFAVLGAADGPVKNALLGYNAARLYKVALGPQEMATLNNDRFARLRRRQG